MSSPPPDPGASALYDAAGGPTPVYAAYLEHQRRYQAARQRYDEAFARAQQDPAQLQKWPVVGRKYRQAVDAAHDAWVLRGQKAAVEAAGIAGGPRSS